MGSYFGLFDGAGDRKGQVLGAVSHDLGDDQAMSSVAGLDGFQKLNVLAD